MEISTQAVAAGLLATYSIVSSNFGSMSAAKSIGVSYVDVEVDTKVEVDCFLCVSTE
jgi:hypothetical protein